MISHKIVLLGVVLGAAQGIFGGAALVHYFACEGFLRATLIGSTLALGVVLGLFEVSLFIKKKK